MKAHVVIARLDRESGTLLAGPAVRAVSAGAAQVTFLCRHSTREAADLLPGIDRIVVFEAPWAPAVSPALDTNAVHSLIGTLHRLRIDQALILSSFHRSPLSLALLLRMAGVPTIAAARVDRPGSLLDVSHVVPDGLHEVERNLSMAGALGYRLPMGDDGHLHVRRVRRTPVAGLPELPYVVVHPGAPSLARAWAPVLHARLVARLTAAGHQVVVTGTQSERNLCRRVAAAGPAIDLSGGLDLAGLAEVLLGASVVVVGNAEAAHLAAAVGTPVVSLFAPTVPAQRWRPWGVDHELFGSQDITCAGCRASLCPLPRQRCLDSIDVAEVAAAVERLMARRRKVA